VTSLLVLALALQVEPFAVAAQKATPEILKEAARLDGIRQEAFDHAVKLLGAKLPEKWRIVLEIVDGADPDPAKFKRHSGLMAETWSESDTVAKIRFYAEYFVNGLGKPESTFRHEMIHAVMRLDLAREKYSKVPKWLREGIAVFGAHQVQDKLWHDLSQPKTAAEPERMVDGLEDSDHNLSDYVEDGLAMTLLKLPVLEEALRSGKTYKEAVEAAAGEPFDAFVARARERALGEIRKVAAEHKHALALYVQIAAKNAESGPECERFLAEHPKSPLRSAVLYYRAKAAKDDGLPRFDEFLKSAREPMGKSDFIDDANLRRAALLLKQAKRAEAEAVYADLVRWNVGSPAAVDALYAWGLLVYPSDRDRATALLKRALEVDPKHRLAAKATKTIGE
jgi:hypothetical protein